MAQNYSMTDFSYIGFNNLANRIINDDNFLQVYYAFYNRFSDSVSSTCDSKCRKKLIEDIIIGNPYEIKPKSILSTG